MNEFIIKNGFRSQGNSEVTGSLGVTGSITVSTGSAVVLNTATTTLFDSTTGKVSIGWGKRNLFDNGGSLSVDWTTKILYDSQATPSASVDWKNRLLINSAGTTILDWQNATFTGTASFATQALSASWAPGGPAGSQGNIQFNNGGTFGYGAGTSLLYDTASRSLHNGNSVGALGTYSHAQGNSCNAYGPYSHAEGESTTTGNASGYYATMTASGVFTISSSYGDLSGAGLFDAGNLIGVDDSQYDNNYTYINLIATSCSFNGTNTLVHVTNTDFLTSTASIGGITNFGDNAGDQYWGGYAAHAQGYSTIALGSYSHTEGNSSNAYGVGSHAEGGSTTYGENSHAEGGGQAYGESSHAEGGGTTYGGSSHAEGGGSAGWRGYALSASIAAGVIKLLPIYGDRTTDFQAGSFVLIQDTQAEIVAGVKNTYEYEISGSAFTSSLTQITLYDTSVTTATTKPRIGVYGNSNPKSADVECGEGSHAEGYATTAYGDYSHTAGFGTQTVGWYQSVVGQGNIPLSSTSSFIVGNGSYDVDNDIWTRSNLLVAEENTVQISGSLQVSGSLIVSPTSSGTPAYTGKDGQIVFGQTGADYKIYVWLGGAWRSGSLS
jgi:hypothetical protein